MTGVRLSEDAVRRIEMWAKKQPDAPSRAEAIRRRVHAVLKRQALAAGLKPPNHKRVYRVMKVHGLLLDRHVGGDERRHDGRIAVDERNRRWCSDGFEIGCNNGERVRVAFALDCCDREAMSFLATTGRRGRARPDGGCRRTTHFVNSALGLSAKSMLPVSFRCAPQT
jgi:transposase InsO family protein